MKNFKHFIVVLIILATVLAQPTSAVANEPEAEAAGKLVAHAVTQDSRVEQLEAYLAFHGSPLTKVASHFIAEADRLNFDWKLVAAIAGVESTFGKHIPTNSYNAWGWGVFTGTLSGVYFKDWKDGITQVSESLRYNYIDKGAETIEQMGQIYAASPAWPWKVRFFLTQIEQFTPNDPSQLDITI